MIHFHMLYFTATTKIHGSGLYKHFLCRCNKKYFFSCTAHQLFDEIPSKHNNPHKALESFVQRNRLGTKPTKFIYTAALNSCAKTRNLHLGLQIHAQILQIGYAQNLYLNSSLIDVYAKCGALVDARKVFDEMQCHDEVSWTSIISGLSQNGYGREAICLFKEMLSTHIRPNCFTYVSVISGCKEHESVFECGALLHGHVIKLGHECNSFVVSSLIDYYSKCGKMDQAVWLFEATTKRDIVLLNSMISGYSRNLLGEDALKLFVKMRKDNSSLSEHTLTSILDACGSLTVLQQGRQVHALVTKMGSHCNVFVVSALINMYSKCGNVEEAHLVFDQTVQKNSILWTSMISGYAQNGRGLNALELFDKLVMDERFIPDHVCFTAVLTACNHAGFLERGIDYFEKMRRYYDLVPEIDQYACLIDLYARNGHLKKAKEVMTKMPFYTNSVMWSSFLSFCKEYGEVELGREAALRLFKLEPHSPVPYITLADIYAQAGKWKEVLDIRKLMKHKGVRKTAGWSWVEVEKEVHVFSAGDLSHPQSEEIYLELKRLNLEMKAVGYIHKQVNEVVL